MTKHTEAQIKRSFNAPSALTEEAREACESLAYAHRSLAVRVAAVCPPSREKELALRHLEEALDWAVKAVVRYPAGSPPPKGSEGGE